MSFGKTKDALVNISSSQEVFLEEALGFFLDFCDDCGGRIDKFSIKSSEDFIKNLRKCNRTILDIMKKCDMRELAEDALDRIEKQKASMVNLEKELAEEEKKIREASKGMEEDKKILLARKEQLRKQSEEKEAEIRNLKGDIALIQRQYESFEEKISELNSTLQTAAASAENAEKEYRLLLIQRGEDEGSREGILEEINSLKKEISVLEEEIHENLQPAREQLKLKKLKLENNIQILKSDLDESENENKKLGEELSVKMKALKESQLEQSELLKSIAESKKQISEITEEIESLREAVDDKNEDRLVRELESKKQELLKKKANCEELLEQSGEIQEKIRTKDQEEETLRSQIAEKKRELSSVEDELARYKEIYAQLKNRSYDIASAQEQMEGMKSIVDSLEKDSRIMAEKFGVNRFTISEGLSKAVAEADGLLKNMRENIEKYLACADLT